MESLNVTSRKVFSTPRRWTDGLTSSDLDHSERLYHQQDRVDGHHATDEEVKQEGLGQLMDDLPQVNKAGVDLLPGASQNLFDGPPPVAIAAGTTMMRRPPHV